MPKEIKDKEKIGCCKNCIRSKPIYGQYVVGGQSSAVGYQDYCSNPNCFCHCKMPKEIKPFENWKFKDWETDFDKIWGQHLKGTPLAKELKFFIRQLLAQEKQKLTEEILKSLEDYPYTHYIDLKELKQKLNPK